MEADYFTILYWFCHTSTWIHHRCTCVPHPEPCSQFPPHTIPLGHPSAPAPINLYHASNLDWQFISHMILYMLQCHSPKSSHPCPLPQSPKDCWPTYRFLRRQVRWSGITIFSGVFRSLLWSTVKGFSVVNEAEVDFFWNSLAFSMIQQMLAIWSLVPLAFLNPAWHLEVLGSRAIEAWLGGFWALLC